LGMLVHVLYKGLEISANAVIHEFAFSATCRKQEKAENPRSTCRSPQRPLRSRQLRGSIYENLREFPKNCVGYRESFLETPDGHRLFRDRFLNFASDNACASDSQSLGRKPKGQFRLPINSHYPFPRVSEGSFECHSCLVMNYIANDRHAHNPKIRLLNARMISSALDDADRTGLIGLLQNFQSHLECNHPGRAVAAQSDAKQFRRRRSRVAFLFNCLHVQAVPILYEC
jgi:hypothetical protein